MAAEDVGINQEFLEKTLGFPVDRFEVKPGSEVGDNYACVLVSVTVWRKSNDTGSETGVNPVHIVIKCYPSNPTRQEFLEASSIFSHELKTYQDIIPELYRFQEELNAAKIVEPPFAKLLDGACVDAEARKNLGRPLQALDNYIIMPDLRFPENGGYRLRDRFVGFDLAHYSLVVEAQARLHALSWAYKCRKNLKSLVDRFPFTAVSKTTADGYKAMAPMVASMMETTRQTYKEDKRIVEAITALDKRYNSVLGLYFGIELGQSDTGYNKDNILTRSVPANEKEQPWRVLLHGDAWSNNMMFRYDQETDKPVKVLFVDLQITREGDPLCDLVYTLYCSTGKDLRAKHLSSMLHVYFDTFTQVCKRLSVPTLPGFTWEEFNRRFRRAKILGACCAVVGLPIMLKNPSDLVDMEKLEIESSSEMMSIMTSRKSENPLLEIRMKEVLEDMIDDDIL